MFTWKKALSLFLATCVLLASLTVSAFAADSPSTYEVCMTCTATVDGLDDTYYTVYARALSFAVGQEGAVTYLLTDCAVTSPTDVIKKIGSAFCETLEKQGLIVAEEDLADLITTENQMYLVYDGESWIGAELAFVIGNTNAAVLKVTDGTDAITGATLATFATGAVSGDAVANFALNATDSDLYGFAEEDLDLNAYSVVTQNGKLTHLTTVSQEDLPSSVAAGGSDSGKAINAIMADITRSYGALGSPLLNSENEVIGITAYDAKRDVTLAVSSDNAARELASRSIITTDIPSEEEAETSDDSQNLGGIGVGSSDEPADSDLEKVATLIKYAIFVAIGLVVILVILLIIRLRRGRDEDDAIDEAEMEEQYEQRQREMRKRHQERHSQVLPKVETGESAQAAPPPNIRPAVRPARPTQTEPAPAPAPVTAPASVSPAAATAATEPAAVAATAAAEEKPGFVTMTVVTGKKKGYSLKVDGRTVIGRDPATCKMLFPASDTTISRTHCVLTYIPTTGDIVLEDLNSANGTYSASGRRLIPGKKYRVRLGDKFYLGTNENMIEVK